MAALTTVKVVGEALTISKTVLSAVRKVTLAESTILMVVDEGVSIAKEAVGHGGCKGSSNGGDKKLQSENGSREYRAVAITLRV